MQGLRYCVESHAIAYPRMHPATQQRGFHAPACQRAPWQLRYTAVFNPKPSRNSPCPPATLSSQLNPQNMPRTWYQTCQKHGIKPSYNQYQNHTNSILPIHVTVFLSFVHLFIHVFIYSYHLRIPVMSLSIHILPIFLSYMYLYMSLIYFYHVYIYSFMYSLFIALFIYVFTIHSTIHVKIQTLAKSRDFSTHV